MPAIRPARDGAFDKDAIEGVANAIIEVANEGVQVGIVVGGGNIWRAVSAPTWTT